ncbi:MAG: DUF305 domain-containing protein [Hyphomicrobiales bacterium]|nr:DUF305 domain-containing protein [Hyphomicrobiales bacterium]MBV8442568.1 DUF305 domain-containing protein [Hyphomicrobiales bacterium]
MTGLQHKWRFPLALCPVVALGAMAARDVGSPATSSVEAPFLSENAVAMGRMMAGMEVKPSGDVDHDFAAMMIPHHQGAIEMAQAELRHGRNEQLRRIAQEIVVDQQQEIAAMRLALGQPLPPSAAAPDQQPALVAAMAPPIPIPAAICRGRPR